MPTPNDLTDAEIDQRLTEALGMRLSVDTNNAHEVGQAVMSAFRFNIPMGECSKQGYDWNGKEHEAMLCGSKWGYRDVNSNNGYGVFLWYCREGKPYQTDIEAHVANYRRTPPNWAGDLATAFTLGEEMRKRGLQRSFRDYLHGVMGFDAACFDMIHATPRQRALAALRTLEEADDGR